MCTNTYVHILFLKRLMISPSLQSCLQLLRSPGGRRNAEAELCLRGAQIISDSKQQSAPRTANAHRHAAHTPREGMGAHAPPDFCRGGGAAYCGLRFPVLLSSLRGLRSPAHRTQCGRAKQGREVLLLGALYRHGEVLSARPAAAGVAAWSCAPASAEQVGGA